MDQSNPPEIYFQCQRCTNCCRWPGEVKIDDVDIHSISKLLRISDEEFIATFTRLRSDRKGLALTEKPDGECIFLEGNDCIIQRAKPRQCAGFPNTWNFPGWRDQCCAKPMKRLENGSLQSISEEELQEIQPDLARV